ncbi:acetyltransferase [Mangrovitalea sediminis]|uniref:acetyltransferase n=1 Tax=Mangrovitalea sediminis TaxID=1982043 RepID=UPI000BE58AF3|nr:acetyltransferase [Mangrovitalea sediminis]
MLLRQAHSGHLIDISDIGTLTDPTETRVMGRLLWGEELPEPEYFNKQDMTFPSGEQLPHCWWDVHYQEDDYRRLHRNPQEQAPGYNGA